MIAEDEQVDAELHRAIEQAAQPILASIITPVVVPRSAKGGGYILHLIPWIAADDPFRRLVLLIIAETRPRAGNETDTFSWASYHLTAAEHRLARALIQGIAVKEYARMASLAPSTVRSHLKQLFAKTGAHRQADLVRLLLG